MRAILRTGMLGSRPLRALTLLIWSLIRHGPTLYALVAWHARRHPDRLALTDAHDRLTWAALLKRADAVAAALVLPVRPGDTVGLLAHGGAAFVTGLLGGLRVGARVLLLPDHLTAAALATLLERQGIRTVLVDDAPYPVPAGVNVLRLSVIPDTRRPRRPTRAGRPALLTSGTTGDPRPVRQQLRPLVVLSSAGHVLDTLRLRAGAPTLLPLPLFHGHGLSTLAVCLGLGAPVHLRRGARAAELWDVMAQERVEVLSVVPTVLHRLLEVPGSAPTLRTVISGSAPLDTTLACRVQERLGDVLYNLYGTSETGLISLATPSDLQDAPGTVGRVLSAVQLRSDPDGTLHALGPLSRSAMKTGDLGTVDGRGRLWLHGRADDVMVIGGETVWPAQIEAVIGALPGVRECAVVPVPHAEYGQAPQAFIVPEPGSELTDWTDALAAQLPRRLRPVGMTVLTELPRTPSGKLLRRTLLTLLA